MSGEGTTVDRSNEIYILCMMYGTEMQIYGVFTDKKLLLDSYNMLLTEDGRCSVSEDYPQHPIIYKLPLNNFIAWKTEWCSMDTFIFYDQIDNYKININEL